MTRTSSLIWSLPPTRCTSRSSSARRSFGCRSSGSSPISSRNTVPPSAASKAPRRAAWAPVNEPFSWPNSSLSISVGGIGAAVDDHERRRARAGSASWIASASKPLPVPVSPSSRTVESVAASRGRSAKMPAHARAAAEGAAPALLGGERLAHPIVEEVEAQAGLADVDEGAGFDPGPLDRRRRRWWCRWCCPGRRAGSPLGCTEKQQWCRDTDGSVSTRSLPWLVPTAISPPSAVAVAPASGPVRT